MNKSKQKQLKRTVRRKRIRAKLLGTATKPRLSVFRSNAHLNAQLVDDQKGATVVCVGDYVKGTKSSGTKVERATELGKQLAKAASDKGIKECVFDRGGYIYTGRVKAFAEGAREAGLKF